MKKDRGFHLLWTTIIFSVLVFSQNVTGDCVYLTSLCNCDSGYLLCEALTEVPKMFEDASDKNLTKVEFEGGSLTNIPPLPPGIIEAVFSRVPLTNISSLGTSAASIQTLSISQAKFTHLPKAFQSLKNLTTLTIADTPIEGLDSEILASLGKSLISLSLDNLNLTEWPPGLAQLRLLNKLSIEGIPLKGLPDDAFTFIADSLTSLVLEDMGFTSIPTSLSVFTKLESLSLSGYKLADVESGFKRMSTNNVARTLVRLTMTNSQLTVLPDLANFTSLEVVYFDNNPISSTNFGTLPSNVSSFYCSNCLLSSIPAQFRNLQSLEYVDLGTNLLTSVSLDSFSDTLLDLFLSRNRITAFTCQKQNGSSLLSYLTIDYNRLTSIPACIQRLSKLEMLSMSNNQITELNFDSLPLSLTNLRMSHNKISNLAAPSSTTESRLFSVDLSYNPLVNIDPSSLNNLLSLNTLYLENTQLIEIPTALTSLTSLTFFDIRDTVSISCPCPVKQELLDWVSYRNRNLKMYGSCKTGLEIRTYLTGFCDRTQLTSSTLASSTTSKNSSVTSSTTPKNSSVTSSTTTKNSGVTSSTTPKNSGVILAHKVFFAWTLCSVAAYLNIAMRYGHV